MYNQDLRKNANDSSVKLWEIANAMGISDSSFSRKLRRELSAEEKTKIISIIEQLKGGDSNAT